MTDPREMSVPALTLSPSDRSGGSTGAGRGGARCGVTGCACPSSIHVMAPDLIRQAAHTRLQEGLPGHYLKYLIAIHRRGKLRLQHSWVVTGTRPSTLTLQDGRPRKRFSDTSPLPGSSQRASAWQPAKGPVLKRILLARKGALANSK
ncbi:hypothetical protein SKAU_G00161500 [Synaphobranchus kaupii]|uniref:Uncharacterized protein n=1 Tax=Synaphobranchus kaupii TaxID=118154 RepID=A0A9Q1IZT5_SYNKA|nr:hypothetical protein SKAU_G00161500 [Synaphobranchus kaupii]